MKKLYFLFVLFFCCSVVVLSQVNQYSNPASATFNNTYVSPDWDALIQIAQAKRDAEKQETLSKMQQTTNRYKLFSKYPDKVKDGWHNVIAMNNSDFCDE